LYRVGKTGKNLDWHEDIHNLIKSLSRQMLHAWQIGFIHPSTGKLLTFEAPIPDDMKNVIDRLKDSILQT
jgi:23S rRNA pseudouridine1911/1915/1917 synthase